MFVVEVKMRYSIVYFLMKSILLITLYFFIAITTNGQIGLGNRIADLKRYYETDSLSIMSDEIIKIRTDTIWFNKNTFYVDTIKQTTLIYHKNENEKIELEYYFFGSNFTEGCDSIAIRFIDCKNFDRWVDSFLNNDFHNYKILKSNIYISQNWSSKSTYYLSLRWYFSSKMMIINKSPSQSICSTISFAMSPELKRRQWKKLAR